MLDISEYEVMAMLELPDEQRAELGSRIGAIVDGFDALGNICTEGVEPLVTVLERTNVLREDVAAKLVTRDELLASAPEQYEGYFQVPGTLL